MLHADEERFNFGQKDRRPSRQPTGSSQGHSDGPEWCLPISVSEIDDFQTETQVDHLNLYMDRKQKQDRRSNTLNLEQQEQPGDASMAHDGRPTAEAQAADHKDWFRPQPYNQFRLITRVIIASSEDKNTTNLVILDEPAYEDYVIFNDTDYKIQFMKHDQDEH